MFKSSLVVVRSGNDPIDNVRVLIIFGSVSEWLTTAAQSAFSEVNPPWAVVEIESSSKLSYFSRSTSSISAIQL